MGEPSYLLEKYIYCIAPEWSPGQQQNNKAIVKHLGFPNVKPVAAL